MAKLSDREIKAALSKITSVTATATATVVKDVPPAPGTCTTGATYFDSSENVFYICAGGAFQIAEKQIFFRYASNVDFTGESENNRLNGRVTSQADITGFTSFVFDSSGAKLPFRGIFSGVTASTDSTDYSWSDVRDGQDAVTMDISSSQGTVFKNDVGSTELKANVYIGGVLSNDATHTNVYKYRWLVGNETICIDISSEVLNTASGTPRLVNASGVCEIGFPAEQDFEVCVNSDFTIDSTLITKGTCESAGKTWQANTLGGGNRTITVGHEDVATTSQFICTVSDIPD